jgi:hypothetical protein
VIVFVWKTRAACRLQFACWVCFLVCLGLFVCLFVQIGDEASQERECARLAVVVVVVVEFSRHDARLGKAAQTASFSGELAHQLETAAAALSESCHAARRERRARSRRQTRNQRRNRRFAFQQRKGGAQLLVGKAARRIRRKTRSAVRGNHEHARKLRRPIRVAVWSARRRNFQTARNQRSCCFARRIHRKVRNKRKNRKRRKIFSFLFFVCLFDEFAAIRRIRIFRRWTLLQMLRRAEFRACLNCRDWNSFISEHAKKKKISVF